MEPQQKQFYDWIMARVKEGQEAELIALLEANYKMQNEETFNEEALIESGNKMLELIKDEHVQEFKDAMAHFASQR